MGDPKEPVDLPDPVCEQHGNPTFPCPECERSSKRADRLLIGVPLGLVVLGLAALWFTYHSHVVCTVVP